MFRKTVDAATTFSTNFIAYSFIFSFGLVALGILSSFIYMATRKTGYHQENGAIYWCGWNESDGDMRDFVSEDCKNFQKLSFLFAKDNEHVYYQDKKITDANPDTYQLIGDGPYAKDDRFVYCNETKVHGANPKTFRIIKMPYARDDKSVFNGTFRMDVENPDDFKVLSPETDKFQGVYLFSDKEKYRSFFNSKITKKDIGYYGNGKASCHATTYRNFRSIETKTQ